MTMSREKDFNICMDDPVLEIASVKIQTLFICESFHNIDVQSHVIDSAEDL